MINGADVLSVRVINLVGDEVVVPQTNQATGIRVDFSAQPTGFYLLEIATQQQKVIRKIVRQ